MKVLLIGGNGFIGSHLIDGLLDNGFDVRVFDIGYERFRQPNKLVDYRISNLNNTADLYEAMLDIDIVFHLASTSVPSTSNIDIINDINSNLISSINILNIAVKQGIKKFIYFSSGGAVYGIPDNAPLKEDYPRNPISSYGILKETIEHYVQLYNRQYGLDYLILRPSNPYGPRQGHYVAQGVISTFLRKAISKDELLVYGDGNSSKDYIYIKDFVNIVMSLIKNNSSGIFNVGSGIGSSLNEIIKCVNQVTGVEQNVSYISQKQYDVSSFVLDIEKLKKQLKANPTITSLKDGIEDTWAWVKSQYLV